MVLNEGVTAESIQGPNGIALWYWMEIGRITGKCGARSRRARFTCFRLFRWRVDTLRPLPHHLTLVFLGMVEMVFSVVNLESLLLGALTLVPIPLVLLRDRLLHMAVMYFMVDVDA
jgi:hypothetical protein